MSSLEEKNPLRRSGRARKPPAKLLCSPQQRSRVPSQSASGEGTIKRRRRHSEPPSPLYLPSAPYLTPPSRLHSTSCDYQEVIDLDDGDQVLGEGKGSSGAQEGRKLLISSSIAPCFHLYNDDVMSLSSGNFVNDSVIDFWLSQVRDSGLYEEVKNQIILFSSLLYQSLRGGNKLSSFTKALPYLFLRDHILIPIPKNKHWLLAIISYPALCFDVPETDFLMSPRPPEGQLRLEIYIKKKKKGRATPSLVILDSFVFLETCHEILAGEIRCWLGEEWKERYPNCKIDFNTENLPLFVPFVTQQNNCFDCGMFLCQFYQTFMECPVEAHSIFLSNTFLEDWVDGEEIETKMRKEIYGAIVDLVQATNADLVKYIPKISFEYYSQPEVEGLFKTVAAGDKVHGQEVVLLRNAAGDDKRHEQEVLFGEEEHGKEVLFKTEYDEDNHIHEPTIAITMKPKMEISVVEKFENFNYTEL